MSNALILKLSCPNRPGIVAAVSTHLFEAGCNILDAAQYDSTETNRFFMRVLFNVVDGAPDVETLRTAFRPIAEKFGMDWQIRLRSEKRRVMLMVSKFDHCLADILYRWRNGEFAMEITASVELQAQARAQLAAVEREQSPRPSHQFLSIQRHCAVILQYADDVVVVVQGM